ncbi:hypothetical protein LK542_24525 [Massilia sp. IC2-477]|uniref:hypothetical protein n=1 Tax=Massilia sp. IC2-477 TaxID=2887198 RepID=UPI001D0FA4D0|nr:hypothetical protein [Massilia sp. IC2-477]MCC2958781.1 hypothetical protein [Massilia sp. IC2-477]
MTNGRVPNKRKLAEFLNAAHRNEQQIIEQHPQIYALMDRLQQSFENILGGLYEGPPTPALLVLTAHGYFLAGVRIALAGQMPPVFPVLRAGLESVLFGLIMTADPSKEQIWAKRATSKSADEKCRKTFTASNGLRELVKFDPELHKGVETYYSMAINSGAHPNVGAVFPHMNIEDGGTYWLAQIRCIHPADSLAVFDTIRYAVTVGAYMLAMMSYVMDGHAPAKEAYDDAHTIIGELNKMLGSDNTNQ